MPGGGLELELSGSLRERMIQSGQSHLISHWERLKKSGDHVGLDYLTRQLQSIDYEKVVKDFKRAMETKITTLNKIDPLPADDHHTADSDPVKRKEWETIGLKAIAAGKVGVLLMAGGQGTRLGSSSPKGLFKVGLPSEKSLFQIQAERIRRLQEIAGNGAIVPWYIMTSEHTDVETSTFFKANGYFGLRQENIIFFSQGEFPCMSNDGKILMENATTVALAPNGNGGLYASLKQEGILADMKKRGLESIHVYGVDNIVVRLGDPVFVGYCLAKNSRCGAKAVPKVHPNEAVGVFALRNDSYQVIEYSEIDEERKNQVDSKGVLLYNAGNIANHYFTVDFLEEMAEKHLDDLEFHIANKKIKCLADDGTPVNPDAPNGIKLEMFVFDVFRFSSELAVLLVKREEEFSPLKNATGAKDSTPETCVRDLAALHKQYLEDVGATVLSNDDGKFQVEISPLVTYAGEGLEKLKGLTLRCPVLIDSVSDIERLAHEAKRSAH